MMVSRVAVSRGCVKHLTFMGWVAHGAGILSMITALATDHWLHRVSDGQHVGVFPCCPAFKCGKPVSVRDGKNAEAFVDIVIVGLLLVGFGWILSLSYFCVTRRTEKGTLFGLCYLASGLVTVGGIALLAGAIEFAATLPEDMVEILKQNCREPDSRVETGFSYVVFVTGSVAFILAGVLLFLGDSRQNNQVFILRARNESRQHIGESSSCNDLPLETVAGHVTSSLLRPPSSCDFSAEIFHGHLPHASDSEDHAAEPRQNPGRPQRVSLEGHPVDGHEVFLQLLCPPSYESLSEFFTPHIGALDVEDNELVNHSEACRTHARSSPLPLLPPNYEDVLRDNPPAYTEFK